LTKSEIEEKLSSKSKFLNSKINQVQNNLDEASDQLGDAFEEKSQWLRYCYYHSYEYSNSIESIWGSRWTKQTKNSLTESILLK